MIFRGFAIVLLAEVVWILGFSVKAAEAPASLSARFAASSSLRPMPSLVFKDGAGESRTLADFRGHAVIINLWARWCAPCLKEMAALDKLQATLAGEGVRVVALDEDTQGLVVVPAYYKLHSLTNLGVFLDEAGAALNLLHVGALPTTFFVAPDGTELGRVTGGVDWVRADNLAFVREKLGLRSSP